MTGGLQQGRYSVAADRSGIPGGVEELTGVGGYYPKDPALLSWRSQSQLALQVFPVAPSERRGSGDLYTGTPSMFERLAFVELARRKPERPIVRLDLR